MKTIDRREFIRQAVAGAGLAALPWARVEGSTVSTAVGRFAADDRITLGETGIVTSRLALGTGTHGGRQGSDQKRMGLDGFVRIIRHGFEQGVDFWDTADSYGTHTYFREMLKNIPREKVMILSKSTSRNAEGMQQDIERFRKELGTDYLDVLLLHCLYDKDWPGKMRGAMDVISGAREKGIVRSFGVSCHSLEALQAAAKDPWTEIIMARLNHAGVAMDAEPDKVVPVLGEANRNGKSIIGMKIIGEGRLQDRIDQSLKFVLGQGFVDAVTIGFDSTQQLDQIIGKIAAVRV